MRNLTIILLLIITSVSCHTATNKNEINNKQTDKLEQKDITMKDTTPKVTGIGGIFFRSKNPKETSEWYGKKLRA